MKNSIHPGVAIGLILVVVVIAGYYIARGMEPQREPNAMSKEEIYKQMQGFNNKMKNGASGNTGMPAAPGAAQPGSKPAGQ